MRNFINIEGFDGSGKTMLAKWMAKEYELIYFKSPGEQFSHLRAHFDQSGVDLKARISYYFSDCMNSSFNIAELLENSNIIMDRYYYTTIAYHLSSMPAEIEVIKSMSRQLCQPNLVLFIDSDFSNIEERLAQRGALDNDKMFLNKEKYYEIRNNYLDILPSSSVIIKNNGTIDEAKNKINEIMTLRFRF